MGKMNRPKGVTVSAWFVIAMGCLMFIVQVLIAGLASLTFWALLGYGVFVTSGIFIFKGLNWGRSVFLLAIPMSLVRIWWRYGFHPTHIVIIIVYIGFLVLLTRPNASLFFSGGKPDEPRVTDYEDSVERYSLKTWELSKREILEALDLSDAVERIWALNELRSFSSSVAEAAKLYRQYNVY